MHLSPGFASPTAREKAVVILVAANPCTRRVRKVKIHHV